jgi:glycosyltransferase involved in cell wall biosynthesis
MTPVSPTPLVSVIIPVRNSGSSLRVCLASLRQQTYPNLELIVVDNHSSDDTREAALAAGARVFTRGPERGAQKNYGAQQALGEMLFFVDADMEVTPEVIAECARAVARYDALLVPEESVGEGFWNACVILERSCYVGDDFTEAARFFRRPVFEQLGGFDESLVASGDDMDLSQRARRKGFKLGRVEARIRHHEGPRTPWLTLQKWRYYGRNMGRYIRQNRREAFVQYLPLRPAWLRHWRRLVRRPVHTAGFMFLKVCQFCGVVIGQLEAKSKRRERLTSDPYGARPPAANPADDQAGDV